MAPNDGGPDLVEGGELRIVRLEAENFMRLKCVVITPNPDGSLTFIQGRNSQGKSSALALIAALLGGKDEQPPEPIRRGAESANGKLELSNGIVLEGEWSGPGKYRVTVKSKDGASYAKPQTFIDALAGPTAFDPMRFLRLEQKKQVETVQRVTGLDFSDLDSRKEAAFSARTEVNREGKALKARFEAMPAPSGLAKVDVAALIERSRALAETQNAKAKLRSEAALVQGRYEAAERDAERGAAEVAELTDRLAAAEKRWAEAQAGAADLKKTAEKAKAQADAAPDTTAELAEVQAQMGKAEAVNGKVRADQERANTEVQLEALRRKAAALTAELDAVDKEREARLAAADLPVPGLAFTADGVTLNGIPLEQASGAEQLRVALGIGISMNPKLRVLLFRDASLLDKDSIEVVRQAADKAKAQVFLEVVSTSSDVGFLIEDGEVVAVDGKPPPEPPAPNGSKKTRAEAQK